MKKSLVLFALAFLFVGFSQAFAQKEFGTWKIVSVDLKTPTDEEETPEGKKFEDALRAAQGTFTFAKGGSFKGDLQLKGGEPVKISEKYKIKEGKLTFDMKEPNMNLMFFDGAIFKVEGNKASISQPDLNGASLTFNLEKTK